MFPDSGVPPGEAINTLPEVSSNPACRELWYSTSRCQPRFDPPAANAMLAEQMNLIMKGEVQYDCASLNNIELAARYLMQRGMTHAAQAIAGPADYLANLDPPMTRYNDYLTLVLIPGVNNTGAVRINIDGRGLVEVRRNDGLQLEAGDWQAGIPVMVSYYGGMFWMIGLVASQIWGCLTRNIPVATGCTLQYLMLSTDPSGCRKIAIYNQASATLAFATTASIYGPVHSLSIPANPLDPTTFYGVLELSQDIINNTIDLAKLNANRILRVEFDADCDMAVDVVFEGAIGFMPGFNSPSGAVGNFYFSVDGVHQVGGTQYVQRSLPFTNFLSSFTFPITFQVSAGHHTIDFYLVSETPTASVTIPINAFPGSSSHYVNVYRSVTA